MSSSRKPKTTKPTNDELPKLDVIRLEDRLTPAGAITGRAFLDFNANGVLDTATITNNGAGTVGGSNDQGVSGIIVRAFDAANAPQGSATTDSTGNYTLSATGTGPYRLEFSTPTGGTFFGPQASSGSGTAVQFVPNGNSSGVNLSITSPETVTREANPFLWTSIYSAGAAFNPGTTLAERLTFNTAPNFGAVDGNAPGMYRFAYSAGTNIQSDNGSGANPQNTTLLQVNKGDVGTTWGLAFNRRTNDLLAASFTKRHAGYGPLGVGGIYRIDPTTGSATTFWDASDAALGNVSGSLPELRAAYSTNDGYFNDGGDIGWNAVGKTGFGGLAVNEAGTIAYVTNLYDRRLYIIPITAGGVADTANISSVAIPVPSNTTGVTVANPLGDLQPFAVEFYNGKVYVGSVNSGETSGLRTDLRAYVYEFAPSGNSGTFGTRSILNESSTVEGVSLGYDRGTSFAGSDNFNAWKPTFQSLSGTSGTFPKYPQPMLTGLSFSTSGELILGIRDRAGDQFGDNALSGSSTNTQLMRGITAGDTLRSTLSGTEYVLENNTGGSGTGNGEGPSGGEYFGQDNYNANGHNDVSTGGIALIPGFTDVVTTAYDPLSGGVVRSGGARWFNLSNGTLSKSYYLYEQDENISSTGTASTFGKSNGVGDLVAARSVAGIEIGNRVWNDTNANGRQDADELGIGNVQLVLRRGGTAVATATTDANGEYYFSSYVVSTQTTGTKVFADLLTAGTYTITIANGQGALSGLNLVGANASGTNIQNDSNATLVGGVATLPVTLPSIGGADHSFDVGYSLPQLGSLSGYAYIDSNNDGLRASETPIAGVTVTLFQVVGGVTTSVTFTTTNSSGFYQFSGLTPGTYEVRETQPTTFADGLDGPGTTGSTVPQNDRILSIPVTAGNESAENNFGELRFGSLSGYVYFDSNNDGNRASETAISGVTVTLFQVVGGTTTSVGFTTTNGSGFYQFTNLAPGTYEVRETQPTLYADGLDGPGTTGSTVPQNDRILSIPVTQGNDSGENNFGELLGAIRGNVFEDEGQGTGGVRNDGVRNGTEPAIAGVTVTLFRVVAGVTTSLSQTTTDVNGAYSFDNLFLQSGYRVVESQPATYFDGIDTPGATGGGNATVNDIIDNITIAAANRISPQNNFAELLGQLSGVVYVDEGTGGGTRNDGIQNGSEAGIAGVTLTLFRVVGGVATSVTFTTTNGAGAYQFARLAPGEYQVRETQPSAYIDGLDTAGPGNGATTPNPQDDTIRTITLGGAFDDNAPANNFGELNPLGSLNGYVYVDDNDDGSFDTGEQAIAGVTVILTSGTLTQTQTTDSNGFYNFTGLVAGSYNVREIQPTQYADGQDTPGTPGGGNDSVDDNITGIAVVSGAVSPNNNFGELAGAISGNVFEDEGQGATRNDGVRGGTEPGIAGTTVTLLRVSGGVTTTVSQTTTNANGDYSFNRLQLLSGYRVVESQPTTHIDGIDTAGAVGGGGVVGPNDVIDLIALTPATRFSPQNNFAELLGRVSGVVYLDEGAGGGTRNDGLQTGTEPGLSGVTVTLFRVVGGVATSVTFTTTDANGAYQFTRLAPGEYQVRETQPTTYLDGLETAGPGNGATTPNPQDDSIRTIVLGGANDADAPQNNFGELNLLGTLSGFVYEDDTNDGAFVSPEAAIGGVTVTLFRVVNGVTTSLSQTTTDNTGAYSFTGLVPGDGYFVRETQPNGYFDGIDTPGTPGGGTAPQDDTIVGVTVPIGGTSPNNNFGERKPGRLSGLVFHDDGQGGGTRNDGLQNGSEPGLAGVTVTLFRVVGTVTTSLSQTTTGGTGAYSFTNLVPGSGYFVRESQPLGFQDGLETPGTPGGGTAPQDDTIRGITVPPGGESPNNNFAELTPRGSLSGFVYYDANNNGIKDPGEAPIPGTTINLFRQDLDAISILGSTTTDANGAYRFDGLVAGTGYYVTENQPAPFLDGLESAPDRTGTAYGKSTVPQNDSIRDIIVVADGDNTLNNFGELQQALLSGFVYEDPNNNGVIEPGEGRIAGVTMTLTGVNDLGQTVSLVCLSDVDGSYGFGSLRPGTYTVTQTQPAAYLDGKDTVGSKGGTVTNDRFASIVLNAGDHSANNNFGELKPALLSGFVYEDPNNNGVIEPGEGRIAGVTMTLTGTNDLGPVSLVCVSASDGSYGFGSLRPGSYKVTQTQPASYLDGKDTAGSKGGTVTNDIIDLIPLNAGEHSANNNFGELRPALLSGFVYEDPNNNGVIEPGEGRIAGVTMTLTGTNDLGPVSLVCISDVDGSYGFGGLRPGTYTVSQTQPASYLDGKDTAGSLGGTVTNDVLASIPIGAGQHSANNNFGELKPGSIAGKVYHDKNNSGTNDGADSPLGNVNVTLTGVNDLGETITQVAKTDIQGNYLFTGLRPGTYSVAETQPSGFINSVNTPGSTGGTVSGDNIVSIPLAPGQNSISNNFGETLQVKLFGYVWIDENQNGLFDGGEKPISGVPVILTGTTTGGTPTSPVTATTDINGRWSFDGLNPGNYTVNQTNTPAGYADFKSQNDGSALTINSSTNVSFTGIGLNTNPSGPLNFGKVVPGAAITQPGRSTPTTTSGVVSKTNFLGSSNSLGGSGSSSGLVTDPVGTTQTTPTYTAKNNGSKPTYVVASAGAGYTSIVRVFDYSTGGERFRFDAFPGFTGGVNTATADVTGDGVDDIVVGAGQGGSPRVKVYDGTTGSVVRDFVAFTASFTGGVWVAAGDMNKDGKADIVVGAGEGGGSHIKIFDGGTGTETRGVFAFDQSIGGGARVAVGDFNNDGQLDILAATGKNVQARVAVINGTNLANITTYFPYANFTGGVFVAAGDVNGDGVADIITGAGEGGGPRVRVSNLNGSTIFDGFVAETSFSGGIRVAAQDVNGDGKADIITGQGIGGTSKVQIYSGANFSPIESFFAFDNGVKTGVFVG
jgi:protocatechuate 3,4-dioxygenase beta subunit